MNETLGVYLVNVYIADLNKPAKHFTFHFLAHSFEDVTKQAFVYFKDDTPGKRMKITAELVTR